MNGLLNLCLYQLPNPSGNKVNVTITAYSLDGQSGICLLKSLSVTPWVWTGTADIFQEGTLSGTGNLAPGGLR
jgi:hypothetical protein